MHAASRPRGERREPGRWRQRFEATLLFALLWWIVSEGAPSSWFIGVPAVALAALVSTRGPGWPSIRPRPWQLFRLAVTFVWHSVRSGVDVARRVLGRRLAIRPAVVSYEWRLPQGRLRIAALALINLQPGTLAAWTDATHVHVHLLDVDLPLAQEVARLETRLAALTGDTTGPSSGEAP